MSEDLFFSMRMDFAFSKKLEEECKRTGKTKSQLIKICFYRQCKENSNSTADKQVLQMLEEKIQQQELREKTKWLLKKETHAHEVRKLLRQLKEDHITPSQELKDAIMAEAKVLGSQKKVEEVLR